MKFFQAVLFLMIGFAGMEIFSWMIHKYIMHGCLWFIHKTHHRNSKGLFEMNDLFSLFFGSISVILIFSGLDKLDFRLWIGCGIALYGISYFVLHDILIHRRIKISKKPVGRYFDAISRAHRDHHQSHLRDRSVCFGLLWVPGRYFRK